MSAAVCSRAIALVVAVASDYLLADHAPEGALELMFPPGCALASTLRAFTRWDSAHFLAVAADGWERHEYSHAFFPLYPLQVRWLGALLARALPLCAAEARVLAAVLLSNGAFVVAACCLHGLSERVLRDARLSRTAALLFCATPASAFFSTAYSESTFAAATFGGLLLLEHDAIWAASLVLGLATACRANGTLHALPVAYAGARRLVRQLLEPPAPRPRGDHGAASGALAELWLRAGWRVGWEAAGTALQLGLVIGPYVAWQAAGYRRVCRHAAPGATSDSPVAHADHDADRGPHTPTRIVRAVATSSLPAGFCEAALPDLYAHVQRSYWGVRLLGYWEWRQLPNFALAAPALLLCAAGSQASATLARARCAGLPRRELLRRAFGLRARSPSATGGVGGLDGGHGSAEGEAAEPSKPSTGDGAMTPRALVYVVSWAVLSALAFLMANVQVATRLVSAACPPFYWYMAHLLLLRGPATEPPLPRTAAGGWLGSRRLRGWLCAYVTGFAVVGTVLHSNAYPWT